MARPIAEAELLATLPGRLKCPHCGVVNFGDAEDCRRCRRDMSQLSRADALPQPVASKGLRRSVSFIVAALLLSIIGWSRSLLLTSEPIDNSQQQDVMRATAILEHAGFSREVVMLRHFANFRATDNWWNAWVGHHQAYAATNFPLGVVTLYDSFFCVAADDTERAAILLHEAQHLLGAGEPAALEVTWREKSRIGWTEERYGTTKVFKNTREWTMTDVPSLFQCGTDGRHDCTL
jgi:hypothetical protein